MTELKTFVQRYLSLFSEGKIESVLSNIIINTCQLMRSALPISTYSQYFFRIYGTFSSHILISYFSVGTIYPLSPGMNFPTIRNRRILY